MPNKSDSRLQGSKYDKILRENMRFTLPGIIEKVLKLDIVNSTELKDKIQITRQKEVDALRLVTDAEGTSYVLQIEFESGNKPKMNFRMAEYRAMLHQIYDHPVKQYVMYMGQEALTTPCTIDLPRFKYEYTLISFSKLPYSIFLSSDEPEEQIMSVLANFGKDDPTGVIKAVLEKLGSDSSQGLEENKYYQQLRVIIQMRNLDTQLEEAMDSVMTFFKEERDVLYKWGEKKGLEKGIEKGEVKKSHVFVENLITELGLPDEQIAKIAEVSLAFVKKIRKQLAAKL